MDKKGFVITGLIYSVLILFLVILFGMLAILANRRGQLNTLVKNISGKLSVAYNNPKINFGPESDPDAWNKYDYLIDTTDIADTDLLSTYIKATDKDGNPIPNVDETSTLTFKVGETVVANWSDLNHGDVLTITATDVVGNITTVNKKIYKNGYSGIYEYGTDKSTPLSYVTGDELIRHYDGINNNGDDHNTSATVWKNLREVATTNDAIMYQIVESEENSGWSINGLEFDGINDYIKMPLTQNLTNLTFEITIYNDAVNNVTLSKAVTWSTVRNTIIIYGSTSGNVLKGTYIASKTIDSNTANLSVSQTFLNIDAKKYTYSVVYNIATQEAIYYTNGIEAKKVALPTISASFDFEGQNIFTDAVGSAGSCRKGIVYSLRMYNKALTATEVAQNYEIDKVRFGITE